MKTSAAAALLSLAVVAAGLTPPAPASPPFALGVLRRDGLLMPFAAFDGHHWKAPWPAPAEVSSRSRPPELPISIADIPSKWLGGIDPETPWTAWMPDGTPHPLKVQKPIEARVFCQTALALVTDYRGGAFDVRAPTVPKDALAVAGDEKIEPILTVSLLAPDAHRLAQVIFDDFNKEEERAARRFSEWRHPLSAKQRQAYPIQLEALYRQPSDHSGWATTYVEAVRKFPPRPEDRGCGLITFVRGWIVERAGKPPVIDLGATIAYCDRAGVSFMQPLGLLRAGGEIYWVYQSSSWSDEFYTVARLRPDGVRPVAAASGGFCRR